MKFSSPFQKFCSALFVTACGCQDAPNKESRLVMPPPGAEAQAPLTAVLPVPLAPPKHPLALPHPEGDERARAAVLEGEGRFAAAAAALRRAFSTEAPSPSDLVLLGRLAQQARDFALADLAYATAEVDRLSGPEAAALWLDQARVELELGRLEAAEEHARAALPLAPEPALAHSLLGRVYLNQSRFEAAELEFERALERDEKPIFLNNLGLVRLMAQRGDAAVNVLERAVVLYGEAVPAFVLNNLGLAHEQSGDLGRAYDAFDEALAVDAGYSKARFNRDRIEKILRVREADTLFEGTGETVEVLPPGSELLP